MNSRQTKLMTILLTASMIFMLYPLEAGVGAANYGKNTPLSGNIPSFYGDQNQSSTGWSEFITSKGDVNGDGYGDLLVCAPNHKNGTANSEGRVYLFFGKSGGWAKNVNVSTADVIFLPEPLPGHAGWSASIAGDVNGDGYADILIGAPTLNSTTGRAYLILGKASGWVKNFYLTNATASFDGLLNGQWAGDYVAGVGDVNGDGYSDFVIGSQYYSTPNLSGGKVYLFFGKATGWAKKASLSTADASFYGGAGSQTGGYQMGAGDLNGDGFADLAFGGPSNNTDTGVVYIIFGKASGWTKDTDLETASDAKIHGERGSSDFGYGTSLGGDLNGDGIDDLVVGAGWDDEAGANAGQLYIFFGKHTGWAKDMSAANADATFLGEAAGNQAGYGFNAGGDINGDGIDDLFIGANANADGGSNAGKAYVILGKTSGWAKDVSLSQADASFVGEASASYTGLPCLITGDLNGDGLNDLVTGSSNNNQYGPARGKAYVIFYDTNKPPTAITSVKAYASADYTNETAYAMQGDKIYVELTGTGGNASRKDVAVVKLSSSSSLIGYTMDLYETAINSGVYRGVYTIKDRTHQEFNWIKGLMGDTVTVKSFTHPNQKADLMVGRVAIMPKADDLTAVEDQLYSTHYYVANATSINGSMHTNATWVTMNGSTGNLSGTPDNSEVGSFWVDLQVIDGFGRSDEHNFTIVVANTPPLIETTDVLTAVEDQHYTIDYNSTDDGQGTVLWKVNTNASAWLSVNETSGVLSGTPINMDVGKYYVNISVNDGNGGVAFHNFTLTVQNVNDRPGITTSDVLTASQGVLYSVDYNATDVDKGDTQVWSLKTNASAWLKINATSGVLSGTPANADVGSYWVNVTVTDSGLLSSSHNFTLTVQNVNDPPAWKDVPPLTIHITSRALYTFDVNATDIDKGDSLFYAMTLTPSSTTASINAASGVITLGPLDAGTYTLNVSATDGMVRIYTESKILVTHVNTPPSAVLVAPLPGATVNVARPTLLWSVYDLDSDPITVNVYLSDSKTDVDGKVTAAKVLSNTNVTTYIPTQYLTPGRTYYWTVIPKDPTETGTFANGTANFTVSSSAKVNHAPTITSPTKVKDATVGKTYTLTVTGSDQDAGTTLTYSLTGAPSGMTIDPSSGQITWKPTKSQTGTFTFNVGVSDGEYKASAPVTFKVNKAPTASLGSMIVPILLILIIVIIAIVLLAVAMRKKPSGKDEEEETEGKDEDEEEEAEKDDEEKDSADETDEPEEEKEQDKKEEDDEKDEEEKDGAEDKEEVDEDKDEESKEDEK